MIDPLSEYTAALAGTPPNARPLADSVDGAFWLMCVSVALRSQRRARTQDTDARRGRTLPDVRR